MVQREDNLYAETDALVEAGCDVQLIIWPRAARAGSHFEFRSASYFGKYVQDMYIGELTYRKMASKYCMAPWGDFAVLPHPMKRITGRAEQARETCCCGTAWLVDIIKDNYEQCR